jgi:nicotinamidase-related amidase
MHLLGHARASGRRAQFSGGTLMKSALLVIDMQKRFYKGKTKKLMDSASLVINTMINDFRDKKLPVIWIQHESKVLRLIKNTELFEIIDILQPTINEERIIKTKMNGFYGTKLNTILQDKNIDNVVVCGYAAQYCVLNTYKGSRKLKYKTSLLKNGIASGSKIAIAIVEKITNSKMVNEIII